MVDLDWGNSIQHLTEIMSNTVAFKLFTNLSILCVAPEFVPLPARITKRVSTVVYDLATNLIRWTEQFRYRESQRSKPNGTSYHIIYGSIPSRGSA